MKITKEHDNLIRSALREDIGTGDITSRLCIPSACFVEARIVARAQGVVSGLLLVKRVFALVDHRLRVSMLHKDGDCVEKGSLVLAVKGPARSVLAGERIALNFLCHLSGISTLTARYVARVKGAKARVYDTRKTTPGYRGFEKYAVRMGGGYNHRLSLCDQILIKDNHRFLNEDSSEIGLKELIHAMRKKVKRSILIELEVDTIAELKANLSSDIDIVMLDNMRGTMLKRAVSIVENWNTCHRKKIMSEISGGVTLATIRQLAETGIDRISVGALTHSAPALDFSLEITKKIKGTR